MVSGMRPDDRTFLAAALAEARTGLAEGGIPIGAALVVDGAVGRDGPQPSSAAGQCHPAR
jgi:tRNA(Arg) A34 adenosine deaminase TadA